MTPGEHLAQVVTEYRLAIELASGAIKTGRLAEALAHLEMVKAPGHRARSWTDNGVDPLPDQQRDSDIVVVEVLCDDCDAVTASFDNEWDALLWETEAGSLCTSCVTSSGGRAPR